LVGGFLSEAAIAAEVPDGRIDLGQSNFHGMEHNLVRRLPRIYLYAAFRAHRRTDQMPDSSELSASSSSPMLGPSSSFYISQRQRLHFVDCGSEGKPPLLLIHGGRDHARN